MSRELRGAEAPDRLTHAEQFWLYQNDRMTWARYVAPHWKRMLEQADPVGKRNLWRLCEPELRAALNELKRNCA